MLKLDGERVVDAVPDIGYLHSGFEKIGEDLNYNQYVTVTDRMNYISPMANNVAWHSAVERLLGIEMTPRCKYIRTISPSWRASATIAVQRRGRASTSGRSRYFLYAFNRREELYDIFETLCGARFTNSYTRVGGLMHDVTPLFVEQGPRFRPHLPQNARRHGPAAESQSHLRRSHQGRRRAHQGRGHEPQLHRPGGPRPAA